MSSDTGTIVEEIVNSITYFKVGDTYFKTFNDAANALTQIASGTVGPFTGSIDPFSTPDTHEDTPDSGGTESGDITKTAAQIAKAKLDGDTDGDGDVSRDEALAKWDKDHDGHITDKELGGLNGIVGDVRTAAQGSATYVGGVKIESQSALDKQKFLADIEKVKAGAAAGNAHDKQTLENLNNFFSMSPDQMKGFQENVQIANFLRMKNGGSSGNTDNDAAWQQATSMSGTERADALKQAQAASAITSPSAQGYQHIETGAQIQAQMDQEESQWAKDRIRTGMSAGSASTVSATDKVRIDQINAYNVPKKVKDAAIAEVKKGNDSAVSDLVKFFNAGQTSGDGSAATGISAPYVTPGQLTPPTPTTDIDITDKQSNRTPTEPTVASSGFSGSADNMERQADAASLAASATQVRVDQINGYNVPQAVKDQAIAQVRSGNSSDVSDLVKFFNAGQTSGDGHAAETAAASANQVRIDQINAYNVPQKVKDAAIAEVNKGNDSAVSDLVKFFNAGQTSGDGSAAANSVNQVRIDQINGYNVPQSVKNQAIAEVNKGNTSAVSDLIKFFNGGKISGGGGSSSSSSTAPDFPPVSTTKYTADPIRTGTRTTAGLM